MAIVRVLTMAAVIGAFVSLAGNRPLGVSASSVPVRPLPGHLSGLQTLHSSIRTQSSSIKTQSGSDDYSDYYYDIEAYDYYCTGGGTYCVQQSANAGGGTDSANDCYYYYSNQVYDCAGLNWGGVEVYGPYGATYGTPMEVYAECDKFTSTGYSYIDDETTTSYTYDPGADLGGITGTASLLNWFQLNPNFPGDEGEGNPAQPSSVNVSFYDTSGVEADNKAAGDKGDHATISGVQNSNNIDDTLNSGGFNITISGTIYRYANDGASLDSYQGTMSCLAGGPHAYDIYNAGYDNEYEYFEGEFETGSS